MKQLIQDLQSGQTILEEVPVPRVQTGQVLIRTHRSLVSLGTERMLVEFGKAGLLQKARQQPEKVRQVLDKVRTDGLAPTVAAVRRKLAAPLPLGYCQAGEVVAVGEGVTSFKVGERVVSNGPHAEMVSVPQNLVARIPDEVSYEEAAFAVIGAIGLQGIRLLTPTFGETVVVTGLGLIGLVAAQLLKANGCRVIGLDFDKQKVDLARTWGIEAIQVQDGSDPVKWITQQTSGLGADAVLITASTKSDAVIAQAAQMCRKRGRIVLVGVIGLSLNRADFYEKELSFQVSCSYGPGRYDPLYEDKGQDYPIGFVRWTAQRNFEAILTAIASGQLQVQPLITERVPLDQYLSIYGDMRQGGSIASILEYAATIQPEDTTVRINSRTFSGKNDVLAILGAGNFTNATLLPQLKALDANIKYIVSSKGLSGTTLAKKFGIAQTTTQEEDILKDPEVNAVLITTRHHLHAGQVVRSLEAGKQVFVEKPLAISKEGFQSIQAAYAQSKSSLTVGFNRRFSPFATKAKSVLGTNSGPMSIIATINAGAIPQNHWTQDMAVGGGRIIGEACHFIDLITFFTSSLVSSIHMTSMGPQAAANTDVASLSLQYQNGSLGVINYFANGHASYAKERIEIYYQGKTIIIDNFRKAFFHGFMTSSLKSRQDKGHKAQFRLFLERLRNGGEALISWEEIANTSQASLAAIESLKQGKRISL